MKKLKLIFLLLLFTYISAYANLSNCTFVNISKAAPTHAVSITKTIVNGCQAGLSYNATIGKCVSNLQASTDFNTAYNRCTALRAQLPTPTDTKILSAQYNTYLFSNYQWHHISGGCGGYPRTDYVVKYKGSIPRSELKLLWCNGIHYKYPRSQYVCTAFTTPKTITTVVQKPYCSGTNRQGSKWQLQGSTCVSSLQICDMGCSAPLSLNRADNTCSISYSNMCSRYGEVYNSSLHKCVRPNQCNSANAYNDSGFCAMNSACPITNASGKCVIKPIRTCKYSNYYYSSNKQECLANTQCDALEYVSNANMCDSQPYCKKGDAVLATKCKSIKNVFKTCGGDARKGNMCYIANHGTAVTSTYKPLTTDSFVGNYKSYEYGKMVNALCTNNTDIPCKFRLTDINATGNNICFTDERGVHSCFTTSGNCTFSGHVYDKLGIKQIRVNPTNNKELIINGIAATLFKASSSHVQSCVSNAQTACQQDASGYTQFSCPASSVVIEDTAGLYSCATETNATNTINSTCAISAKVGQYNKPYVTSDIISAKSINGVIQFWDPYMRGYIGNISILPTISAQDAAQGYSYKSPDEAKLLREGFTGFTYIKNAIPGSNQANSNMYAVYDGTISKTECEKLIKGTSFAIAYPTNQQEQTLIKGLSLQSNTFNCVVESNTAIPFSQQKFSVKNVSSPALATNFVCSPLKCSNHECQYNQCPTNFTGGVYHSSTMNSYIAGYNTEHNTNIGQSDVCINNTCDSNLPYLPYCGNKFGCPQRPDVYQRSDGTCAEVTCPKGSTYNAAKGKCEAYGCVNSIEKDGKCYKTISTQ